MPNETEDYNNAVRAALPAGMTYSGNRYRYNSRSFPTFKLAAWYYYYIFRTAYSPLNLFSANEVGAWYDPSDLTTLFQDSAGTTPVTAAGQSVGLMLDKSQGLVLGNELTTNGDFSTDSVWLKEPGWSISGGKATKVAGTDASIYQSAAAMVQGLTYLISFTVSNYSAGSLFPFCRGTLGVSVSANGTYTQRIVAGAASAYAINFYAPSAFAGSIDNISVKLLAGNHATQSTAASRPTYQVISGLPCLVFDGVDDFLVTPTITPNTDKVQVFAGVRKLSDAALGIVVETSTTSMYGSFTMAAPEFPALRDGYTWESRGAGDAQVIEVSGYPAPTTLVIAGQTDLAAPSMVVRTNGAQTGSSTPTFGGNFLAYPLYIGRRAGTSLPFNGQLYGLITRFGANLNTNTISATESWLAAKTGVIF